MTRMGQIARIVCAYNSLKIAELKGPTRERSVAWPRQRFMRLARDEGFTLNQIGGYLGNRHHTTIMHGIDADKWREKNETHCKPRSRARIGVHMRQNMPA